MVFTQREVWPTLAAEAAARRVPTVLIAGTMPEGAGRISGPGRVLLGPTFRSLRAIAAVSQEDGERFGLLGVRSDRVTVTGDPGIDAARERVAGIDREAAHMRIFDGGCEPVLVAGSTWPSDEDVLIPALTMVRESVPGLRIVLAPHEPDGYDFAALSRKLAANGWTPALLGDVENEGEVRAVETVHGVDVILVDRVGVLADLYTLATVAYVGGGFHASGIHKRGLHSVLEPAAAGVPVLMGPGYQGSVHATRLLAVGAARAVTDAEALAHALEEWLGAREKNEDPGGRAMDYIENHRGSAGWTADLIAQFFLPETRPGNLSEGKT
jgi:3-deoxy-D-manno-octulosonic-acid transferase